MHITLKGGRFLAQSTYAEKGLLDRSGAGFSWDPQARGWWTDDVAKAAKVRDFCDALALAAIKVHLAANAEQVEASQATDADIEIPCNDGLAYLPFQRAGIAYALKRNRVLIGDEMGLGKTIQALGIINASKVATGNVLIVCPASLRINWSREASKWLVGDWAIEVIATGKSAIPEMIGRQVVIVNYDLLKAHHATLSMIDWDTIVVDEAHYLKNAKTIRTKHLLGGKGVASLTERASKVIFLTGTPVVNRPCELWTTVHELDRQGLGRSWMDYHQTYCAAQRTRWGWDVSGSSNTGDLQRRLRETCMVRRLKADVLTELPAKRRQVIELPVNGGSSAVKAEWRAYEGRKDELDALRRAVEEAEILEDQEAYREAVQALREGQGEAFADMSRTRQAVAMAKLDKVAQHVIESSEQGPVVVMAHHHAMVDGLRSALTEAGISHVSLTGRDSQASRQDAVDRFQAGEARVFLGNIYAAGVGITLTRSSHVIFAELDWVPGALSQAEDRCHRIGQRDSVLVQHLVLEGSLDAYMANTLIGKQEVISSVLDGGGTAETLPERAQEAPKPSKVAEVKAVSSEQVDAILEGLRTLASLCDGARAQDGMGFSKLDADFGHKLSRLVSLSARQAHYGAKIVNKYRRQLDAELVARAKGE